MKIHIFSVDDIGTKAHVWYRDGEPEEGAKRTLEIGVEKIIDPEGRELNYGGDIPGDIMKMIMQGILDQLDAS